MIELRPYQQIAVDEVRAEFRLKKRRVLLVMPTGAGKTVAFSYIVKGAVSKGNRVLILAHRTELLEQISSALEQFNVDHSFISAGYPYRRWPRVHVGGVHSVIRRLDKIDPPDFIICDEAHHCISANTWGAIIQRFPNASVLGCTATPRRASGEGLGQVYDSLVVGPTVSQLIHSGYLSDFKIYGPPSVNTEWLHIRAGEFIQSEVAAAVDRPSVMGDAISHYKKLADDKQAILYTYSVEHSKAMAEAFRQAGYKAEHIDGQFSKENRQGIFEDFRARKVNILCNVDLFGEGIDVPGIECGILLRPTASESLYLQQVGRCLRKAEGKDRATIIDHSGNARRHGLPDEDREWSLEGREHKAKAKQKASIKICPQCFYANHSRSTSCAECRYEFAAEPREVAHVDGELVEIQRREARKQQGHAQSLDALIEIGKQRNYRNPAFWARKVIEGRKHG